MLERMSGKFYKKFKLENFVDPPFTHYQSFINKTKFKKAIGNKQYYPWIINYYNDNHIKIII